MTTTTIHRTTRSSVFERIRPWWLWIVTAFAFPPAGWIGDRLFGPVDGLSAAFLAGVITGALIGVAQWAVLRRRGGSPGWIVATAAGFGVGLAAGAALVDYETSLGALMVMGAVCGVAVGLAQVASFAPLRRHAVSWTLATGGLWASGWAVTTAAGIKVEDQWPVFGISGALVVAVLQSVLINRLVPANQGRHIEVATVG
jgi:MFS family permease